MLKLTPQSVRARGSLLQIIAFAAVTTYIYFTTKNGVPIPAQCVDYANQKEALQNSGAIKMLFAFGFSFAVYGANLVISAMISAWKKTKQLQEL